MHILWSCISVSSLHLQRIHVRIMALDKLYAFSPFIHIMFGRKGISFFEVKRFHTAVVTWDLFASGPCLARPKSESFGLNSSSSNTFAALKSRNITCYPHPESPQLLIARPALALRETEHGNLGIDDAFGIELLTSLSSCK